MKRYWIGALATLCVASPAWCQALEMPESSTAALDCPVALQEAEAAQERGRQLATARRWKDAVLILREAAAAFGRVTAACPAQAAQAGRQVEGLANELRQAEAASAHQTECLPRLDRALELDLKATAARSEKADPAEVERLLGEAETIWREAVGVCQSPHREKADRSLAATVRQRAANAELLSSGPACDAAWKSAGAMVDYARLAWKEKRWDDAASLYGKAVIAWEGAAEKCSGSRQQQAQRKAEQTQVDAHNAEHCAPLWDAATELAQRIKSGGSAAERDAQSIRAEVAWREAASACRGNPQSMARGNADALARERGAPLPPQAMAQYASRRAPPSDAPAAAPATVLAAVPAATQAVLPAGKPPVPPLVGAVVPAPAPVAATAPASTPDNGVLVAGNTTYRGAFAIVSETGEVSGTGTVEWANGERFRGSLVKGKRQGKGRFDWGNGQWYEGDWVNDRAVGVGVLQFAGGNRYEGAVQDGEPSGRGVLVFASGDRYAGEFLRGAFHGQGSYAWKNGNRYEGAWVMGKKHGQGRFYWSSGDAWEGEFRDDLKTDVGREITASR